MKVLHHIKGLLLESPHYIRKEELDYIVGNNETYIIKSDGNVYIIPLIVELVVKDI